MIYNNNIKKSFFYNLFIKYIYPIILLYYPIKIINKQNIYQKSYLLDGKLNMVPSLTPAEGQRWVMVLRLV